MSQKARIDDFEVQKRDYISHTESIKTKYEETISTLKRGYQKGQKRNGKVNFTTKNWNTRKGLQSYHLGISLKSIKCRLTSRLHLMKRFKK